MSLTNCNFNVHDDLVDGLHSFESAKKLQQPLTTLLKSGGFHLRKCRSNAPELLKSVISDLSCNNEH